MSDADSEFRSFPAPLVALAGWVVPGAGYWLIGQRKRGTIIGVTILSLFFLGILIAGVRVIEVPGFGRDGSALRMRTKGNNADAPLVISGPGLLAEIVSKPWFVPQALVGPVGLASGGASVLLGQRHVPAPHERIAEIGTLYTAVAGMLNLLAVIDSAHRAGRDEEQAGDDDRSPAGSTG